MLFKSNPELEKSDNLFDWKSVLKKHMTAESLNQFINLNKVRDSAIEHLSKTFGILSLSEKNNNSLMWSHYANMHKGFAIGFDSSISKISATGNSGLRKVMYSEEKPSIEFSCVDDFINVYKNKTIEEAGIKSIFTKNPEWSYEKEWRMIVSLVDANQTIKMDNEEIHLFNYNPSSIKEIIFGHKMSSINKESIITILKDNFNTNNIQLMQTSIDYNSSKINISEYLG